MKILILLILLSSQLFAIELFQTKHTESHVWISGSKISLVPPKDFTPAQNFSGFENRSTFASIMLNEIPTSVDNIVGNLTPEALLKQDVKLIKIDTLKINGYKGVLVEGRQTAYGKDFTKYILIFGDDSKTIMINGAHQTQLNQSDEIKKSILSIYYDSNRIIDPLEGIKFSIDVSNTKFKFANTMSGTVIYTVDGQVPPQSEDKSMLMVSNSIGSGDMELNKGFAIERMKNLPVKTFVNENEVIEVEINGLKGYELISYQDPEKNINDFTYMIMLFDETNYYMIIGIAIDDVDTNHELYKSIARTFKLK